MCSVVRQPREVSDPAPWAAPPPCAVRRLRLAQLGPALENRDFRLWWLAMFGVNMSLQMLEVAIGWQVYAQHKTA